MPAQGREGVRRLEVGEVRLQRHADRQLHRRGETVGKALQVGLDPWIDGRARRRAGSGKLVEAQHPITDPALLDRKRQPAGDALTGEVQQRPQQRDAGHEGGGELQEFERRIHAADVDAVRDLRVLVAHRVGVP